jgi:RNA polymerase sigma-70 factor (ECF subfamily)
LSETDELESYARALVERDDSLAASVDRAARRRLAAFCANYLSDVEAIEDVVQDGLAKLLAARPAPSSPRAWLLRVLRNACLDRLRAGARRADDTRLASSFGASARTSGPATRAVRNEDAATFAAAIASFDERTRELLRLRYGEGLSRAEIADVLEIGAGLVKSRLFECVERLRTQLGAREV